jgi:acyl carrier protein
LPEPQFNRPTADAGVDLPGTPLEEMLLESWQEVLNLNQIGVNENFFDLGGHSLLAARLVSNIRSTMDVELNMVDVFEAPTISTMAELLYPRVARTESDTELARLIEELAGLSEEEAQLRLDRELGMQTAIA